MNNFTLVAANADSGVLTKAKASYCKQSASYNKKKATMVLLSSHIHTVHFLNDSGFTTLK